MKAPQGDPGVLRVTAVRTHGSKRRAGIRQWKGEGENQDRFIHMLTSYDTQPAGRLHIECNRCLTEHLQVQPRQALEWKYKCTGGTMAWPLMRNPHRVLTLVLVLVFVLVNKSKVGLALRTHVGLQWDWELRTWAMWGCCCLGRTGLWYERQTESTSRAAHFKLWQLWHHWLTKEAVMVWLDKKEQLTRPGSAD